MRLATNAPEGWPTVSMEHIDPAQPAMNAMAFAANLGRAMKALGAGWDIAAFFRTRLLEGGVLEIPIVVDTPSGRVPVYFYDRTDASAAAEFAGAQSILRFLREREPVYFAPAPLPAAKPASPLRPLTAGVLSKFEGRLPSGEYAMWWTTPEDSDFLNSRTVACIDRTYQALDEIETYVFADILRGLGLVQDRSRRMQLPPKGAQFLVEGPEDRPLILTASEEKGLRWHFHSGATPESYRYRFSKLFAEYAERWKRQVVEQRYPRDARSADYGPPARHWGLTKRVMSEQDNRGKVASVGLVVVP